MSGKQNNNNNIANNYKLIAGNKVDNYVMNIFIYVKNGYVNDNIVIRFSICLWCFCSN